jgi:type I restriction enzyme, S subunit
MSEGMAQNGWTRVAFGDVVRQVRDRVDPEKSGLERYVAGEHMETDDLRIRRWGRIGDGYLGPAFHMRFKPGQVLYGSRRTYLRKVAIAEFEGITANTTFVLEPKDPEVLIPGLLPFLMQTEAFQEHSIKQSKGSVNPYVNFSDLTWYEFRLPPTEQQRRILSVLHEMESVTEVLRNLASSSSVAEVALVEEMVLQASDTVLMPVANLVIEPPRNGLSPISNSTGTGLKTVSISAVSNGRFDPRGFIKHADIVPDSARSFFVKCGDVFVIRGNGNRQLCGKAGLSDQSYDDLFYPDLLIRLRFDPDRILPEVAVVQWNLASVHGRLAARAKSSNGIWKVNGQDIRAHRLFVPSLSEQKKLIQRLRQLRLAVTAAYGRRNAAVEFKAVVLKHALNI